MPGVQRDLVEAVLATDTLTVLVLLTGRPYAIDWALRRCAAVAGDDVVQLYGHDVVGTVTRPVAQLLGYRRVHLLPKQSTTVRFMVPTARLAFTDRTYTRVVELWVGTSAQREAEARTVLVGPAWPITVGSPLWTRTELLS